MEDARGRTGTSPAHPFGSLAAIDESAEGPRLCVAAFRRVCPFEDERRWDPGWDAMAYPRPGRQSRPRRSHLLKP
jgi:hypothetical protein